MHLNDKSRLLITCFPGCEPYLREEVKEEGFAVEASHATGVEFPGSLRDAMRLNLTLRTALNILYLLREFRARDAQSLYDGVAAIPWEDLIAPDEYLSVTARVDTPAINNSMFASVKVKDAIVDRIARRAGRRPNSGPERDHVVIALYWKDDFCRLFLNTSGEKLSDRGYRLIPHTAPLRETLAAALLLAAGYDGSCPLVCPMCGSGTLAIEGAWIALHRAPGLLRRNFGFMHVKPHDPLAWERLREDIARRARKSLPHPIVAADHDPSAVEAARQNARNAGIEHLLRFEVCDVADTPVPEEPGIVMLNPEYGERMGDAASLEPLYQRIGDFFKQKCVGSTGYVFTGSSALAKKIGLRSSRRIPFYNARIECRLIEYALYKGRRAPRATAP